MLALERGYFHKRPINTTTSAFVLRQDPNLMLKDTDLMLKRARLTLKEEGWCFNLVGRELNAAVLLGLEDGAEEPFLHLLK